VTRRSANIALQTLIAIATSWIGFQVVRASIGAGAVSPDLWLRALPWVIVFRLAGFVPAGVSQGLWRYTSVWDLRNFILAVFAGSLGIAAVVAVHPGLPGFPQLAVAADAALLVFVLGGARLAVRLRHAPAGRTPWRRILVYGAGDAGELIVRDIVRDGRYLAVGFIDDDPQKRGRRIHGVTVLGTRAELRDAIERTRPDEFLVAIPSASPQALRGIVKALEPFTLPIRTLPSLQQLVSRRVTVGEIQDLAIEDLLRRSPAGLEISDLRQVIAGRRVLVTGAGGSIGSELCRQIAGLDPEALFMLDRHENGLHAVACDLADRPFVRAIVGDITDAARLDAVFALARPEFVFHAAAHKHVPLMEHSPCEAVKNNVTGTRMLAEAAVSRGVRTFVFISTDKAVRPSSVMGASKRVAELIVQHVARTAPTRFVTVRFGNVLGSSGSVVPTFLQQIRGGGPVTITHPEVSRLFMLIPEAVQLVLHACALNQEGNTCVLDMGDEVKIADLARQMIRLSGFVPDEEIPIVFTGLRQGEKLHEELVGEGETTRPSTVQGILWVDGPELGRDADFWRDLQHLEAKARLGVEEETVACLRSLVSSAVLSTKTEVPYLQRTH